MREEKRKRGESELSAEEMEILAQMMASEGVEMEPVKTITRRVEAQHVPLSFAQERLWFFDRLQPGNPVYNLSTPLLLQGSLDVEALEQAIGEVVRRHEALRTTFTLVEARPVQVIGAPWYFKIPLTSLEHLSESQRQSEAARLIREEARQPFDLTQGPLLRARLLRFSKDEHVALFTMHHIISDGWSEEVLTSEIATLYEAFSAGRPSPLPELSIQYADFTIWQREHLEGETLEQQLSYWRQQLSDIQMLELPTDRPRPAVQRFRGRRLSRLLSNEIKESLKTLGQQEEATLFMSLLTAFNVLLYRFTHQSSISVGTPIANRQRAELEGLIGCFVNTLVLRTAVTAEMTFRELLAQVREVCLGAYAHQEVPFERLVEELRPDRDLSHTPLFQVMFVLQHASGQELQLRGLKLTPLTVESETAKFDLTMFFTEMEAGLEATVEYNGEIFGEERIERMLGHLEVLLEAVVEDAERRVADLPLLTAAQRDHLLQLSTRNTNEYNVDACLHEMFERQAERTPHAVALIYEDEQLSYQELNARANRLAHHLRSLGVGAESLVAIFMERSIEMVVAILAILKAGAAYLPLDPQYPQARLEYMLSDADVTVLLTQQYLAGSLPPSPHSVVIVDHQRWGSSPADKLPETELKKERESTETRQEASRSNPDNLAYVIYTSGSTGSPKGVQVTHRNVARLFAATQEFFDFDGSDVWTLFHSYAFDFSVWELWGALLYGGKLVVVPYWVSRTPEEFYDLLRREGVTVLNQTPSAFGQLMRVEEARAAATGQAGGEQQAESGVESLRYVIFGGEALEVESLRGWFERHGDERPQMVNMYGITETTVHVTYRRLRAEDVQRGVGSVIGRPLGDLEMYVLDERLEPSPLGVSGEIYVGGGGLARGYLKRGEVTGERFVPHGYSERGGERLYRTGDLGRYVRGGEEIEYVGRGDEQVKVRGYRIELGEIEAALREHPSASQVVAVLRQSEMGDKEIVAYVVAEERLSATVEELRRFVERKLPQYMMPAVIMLLDELPLTPNGKVDRRALPAPGQERRGEEESYVAPQNEVEELLAVFWADVLNVERVGIHDNFFALGGDSIRSVRLLALAKEGGLEFSLQQLFRHQTIHELAGEIAMTDGGSINYVETGPFSLISEADRLKLPPDVEDAYPLTKLQAGMFYHMELTPDVPVYHNVDSWKLRAFFDEDAFQRAAQQVVARHPILRTSFDLTSYTEQLQLVHKTATLPLQVTDLRHLPAEEQRQAIDDYTRSEESHRFDISSPPLLRIHVHLLSEEIFQFTLTESHPIFDGWSLNSTLSEIFTLYFALLKNQPTPIAPPPTVTFRDFVALERMTMESEECRQFWAEKLRDSSVITLPRWSSTGRNVGQRLGQSASAPITPQLSEGIKALARSMKVPVKSVLLAAHMKVLSLLGGQTDVMCGLVCNGRPEVADGDQVRGLFLNSVPLRLKLSNNTWADLVQEAFDAEWELLPYRRYPLSELQRQNGGQPLFEVQFNYVHFHTVESVLRSGDIEVLDDPRRFSEETHFTLAASFGMDPLSFHVYLELQYNALALREEQMAAISGYYVKAFEAMVREPSSLHNAHSLLSAEEQHQLLVEWNSSKIDYSSEKTLHELFAEQVEHTPDAVALLFEDQQLSYQELNARANQLAHHLRSLGVGVESLVAVCMERSIEMVVSLLAILKAGAAYLPLDPQYPSHRLALMLLDSGASLLLTQAQLLAQLLPVIDKSGAPSIAVDTEWTTIAAHSEENPERAATADNLIYVIYTSGSTGQPKGCLLHHRGILNCLRWMQDTYQLTQADAFLVRTSLSFDPSVWEIFWPLLCGARLVVAPPHIGLDSAELLSYMRRQQVTCAYFVPSLLGVIVKDRLLSEVESLRYVISGGEKLSEEVIREFYEGSGAELHHSYGPTEASIAAAEWRCERGDEWGEVLMGRGVGKTQLYVLDERMEAVPVGVNGELYIGGEGVGRGYLNRAGLTAERFVPDVFSKRDGGRLYRTGDVVRWRKREGQESGELEYVGRRDEQVKVRGYRIELGEIEAALREHPSVSEAVAMVWGEGQLDKQVVAYILGRDGESPSGPELLSFLREKLPEYMIPASFVMMDSLPLLLNGKVNRRELPPPEPAHSSPGHPYVAPSTPTEETLADIWREVLNVERVGIYDNFFELGGHSLLATQAITRIRNRFNVELPMRSLFEAPTVARLAIAIVQSQAVESEDTELERLLLELEELPEDNAQSLLINRAEQITGTE